MKGLNVTNSPNAERMFSFAVFEFGQFANEICCLLRKLKKKKLILNENERVVQGVNKSIQRKSKIMTSEIFVEFRSEDGKLVLDGIYSHKNPISVNLKGG